MCKASEQNGAVMSSLWKTLIAMFEQYLSFCLGATYDTLPSHFSFHVGIMTQKEASCLLCRKEICTTAHVLGACIVALLLPCNRIVSHVMIKCPGIEALNPLLSFINYNNAQNNNSLEFVEADAKLTKYTKKSLILILDYYTFLLIGS